MLSRLLRVCLLYVVHFAFMLVEKLHDVKISIKEYFYSRNKLHSEDDLLYLSKHVRCLKKVPSHIAVVVNKETLSYNDLAKLVIWSLTSGVSFISFYDKNGLLKKNEERIFKAVERRKEGVPGYIRWSQHSDINGYTNGTSRTISVFIFEEKDGLERIVKLTQSVCKRVVDDVIKTSDINVEHIDRGIKQMYPQMSDPDIVIYTGRICRSDGFPPWQIRLSEFYGLSYPCRLSMKTFLEILQKYSKCQQRYGI